MNARFRPPELAIPDGLWSLWDMINYGFEDFINARLALSQGQQRLWNRLNKESDAKINVDDKNELDVILSAIENEALRLSLESTKDRLLRTRNVNLAEQPIAALCNELRVLFEAMEDDIKKEKFYHYSRDKSKRLNSFEDDWAASNRSFGSSTEDARCAVDCHALGQNTAAVFHSMRVLEKGLGALASNVGKTYNMQHWHGIIGEIESEITNIRQHGIQGMPVADKNARLQFLSEAAKEFAYFKDGWRNYVSHGRGIYDEHQALSVLEHTRVFMNHLSTKLSE